MKKTNPSVYGILNESFSPKDLKSYRMNPNIFKYWNYGESKVLVWDTKRKITYRFVLLYAIINEKTVKLMQLDRLYPPQRLLQQKQVPITLLGDLLLSLIYLGIPYLT